MSRWYLHSGLTGNSLHDTKIKFYAASDPMPTPQWAGQLISKGDYLYFAQATGSPPVLNWRQVKTPGGALPSGAVTYVLSTINPESTTGSGKIHVNTTSGEVWFLANNQWIKIGPKATGGGGTAGFTTEPTIIGTGACSGVAVNALLLSNWQTGINYGFLIDGSPSVYGNDSFEVWAKNSNGDGYQVATPTENNSRFKVTPSDFAAPYPYLQIIGLKATYIVTPQPDGPPIVEVTETRKTMCFTYQTESRVFNIAGVFQ